MRGERAVGLAALVAGLVAAGAVAAQQRAAAPPAPQRFVTDGIGFLSPAVRDELDGRLAAHERATGQQVLLWIGDVDTGGSLEEWAARTFQAWAVGRKGKDDGVAIFLLPGQRKIRIEVGYGLEAWLTDARAARIIREQMAPRLQGNDRDGAARAAVEAVLAAITPAADPNARPPAVADREQGEGRGGRGWFELIAIIIFLVFIAGGMAGHPAAAAGMLYTIGSHRRRGGGGFGGGGFGGGGFGGGGFSGGGGRSGGGGASGSW